MYKTLLSMILLLSLSGSLFECAVPLTLQDYKPKSSEEEGIIMTLAALESAWNRYDQQGVLSLFHENAQLMTERQRSIVSKKEFAVSLQKRMTDFSPTKLYEPTIQVAGNNASAKLLVDMGPYQNEFTFQMIRENNRWLILGWKY